LFDDFICMGFQVSLFTKTHTSQGHAVLSIIVLNSVCIQTLCSHQQKMNGEGLSF